MGPLPSEAPSCFSLHPTALGCHRALGWAPCVIQQIPTGSHTHMVICMFPCYSPSSSHSLLPPVCPKVCSLSVSTAALQIGSWVPSSYIPYTCVNTQYLFFLWLTSLCITDSRFIHLIRTHSHAFFFFSYNWITFQLHIYIYIHTHTHYSFYIHSSVCSIDFGVYIWASTMLLAELLIVVEARGNVFLAAAYVQTTFYKSKN